MATRFFRVFKKMVSAHQGCAWPETCQSVCEGTPSKDRLIGSSTFGLPSTSVCQQCQATAERKLAPELDTTQEPAY